MIDFVKNLQAEIQKDISCIERSEDNDIKKSLEVSHILGEAFDRLKEFIISYEFKSEEEEIEFFKEIKPRLFCKLIYYRKIYNIEMMRPVASTESQKDYLKSELAAINTYMNKRLDFIRYYRSEPPTWTVFIFCAGRPIRNNTSKRSIMNSIRIFLPTVILR